MDDINRKKTTIWLKPDIISRMDGWLEADNCKSRGEFVEKALRFYMGYLSSEDVTEYLSKALVVTLRGILEDNANRLRSLLFKWAVELNMMMHVIARHFGGDRISLRELRGFAVDEVKRTCGQISFDEALHTQREFAPDDEWQG
jgi:hypothetical protein